LAELLKYNLRSIRSYLLKEEFQLFWQYTSPHWAGMFLDKWCTKTMRSKIEPTKKVARMLRRHRPLLLNWFKAKKQFSSGIVEGFNTKAKLTTRKAYGCLGLTMRLKLLYITRLGHYLTHTENRPRIFLRRQINHFPFQNGRQLTSIYLGIISQNTTLTTYKIGNMLIFSICMFITTRCATNISHHASFSIPSISSIHDSTFCF